MTGLIAPNESGIFLRYSRDEIKRRAIGLLESRELLQNGDMAIITKGDQDGQLGVTNALKIVEVGKVV